MKECLYLYPRKMFYFVILNNIFVRYKRRALKPTKSN